MIVWSGRGFLSAVVLIVSIVILAYILPKEQGNYGIIISLFIAGIFSWFMGKKWNQKNTRTLVDKESGQEVTLKPNHSLFWIKMEYWGLIFGVLGLVVLVKQFL